MTSSNMKKTQWIKIRNLCKSFNCKFVPYVRMMLENCLHFIFLPFSIPLIFLPSNQHESVKSKDNRVMSCCYALHEAFFVIVRNIYRMSVQFTLLRATWNGVMRSTTKDWMEKKVNVWVRCEAEKSVMQTWKPSSGKGKSNPKRKILFFQEMNSSTSTPNAIIVILAAYQL